MPIEIIDGFDENLQRVKAITIPSGQMLFSLLEARRFYDDLYVKCRAAFGRREWDRAGEETDDYELEADAESTHTANHTGVSFSPD